MNEILITNKRDKDMMDEIFKSIDDAKLNSLKVFKHDIKMVQKVHKDDQNIEWQFMSQLDTLVKTLDETILQLECKHTGVKKENRIGKFLIISCGICDKLIKYDEMK